MGGEYGVYTLTGNDEYILQILEGVGLISRQQAKAAMEASVKADKAVIDVLVQSNIATKSDIMKSLRAGSERCFSASCAPSAQTTRSVDTG